jgi:hypothetical protein
MRLRAAGGASILAQSTMASLDTTSIRASVLWN